MSYVLIILLLPKISAGSVSLLTAGWLAGVLLISLFSGVGSSRGVASLQSSNHSWLTADPSLPEIAIGGAWPESPGTREGSDEREQNLNSLCLGDTDGFQETPLHFLEGISPVFTTVVLRMSSLCSIVLRFKGGEAA